MVLNLNFVCFGVKLSCILRSFEPWDSSIQTFECVGLLILHDLDRGGDLRSNERLSVDLDTPVFILYEMGDQQLEVLEKPMHVCEFSVYF